MSTIKRIDPNEVIPTIRQHMIGDGFEFVVDMKKSHGSKIYDLLKNREILDFYSCFASSPLGFNHPGLTDDETLDRLKITAVNNVTNSDLFTQMKAEFIETFYDKAAPARLPHMFLIAGGALAVENALKAAFDWKARMIRSNGQTHYRSAKIVHLRQAFHGRSGYTMSLTNTDPVKTDLFPKFDWPRIDNPMIVFPDEGDNHEDLLIREKGSIDQFKHAIMAHGDDIAAFIMEPIQGEGGDNHFRGEFMLQVQELCNENNIMFILDEIQSGMGISGKVWAYQHFGLEPDMICFGKKTQVCGFLASDKIDSVKDNVFNVSSRINSTWGGNLVDMVRCQRYLEIIEEDKLVDNADRMGELLKKELLDIQDQYPDLISNTRGRGLMCAFDLKTSELRDQLRNNLYDMGMLILSCGDHSLRFRPVLTINEEDIGQGIGYIKEALAKMV